MKRILGLLFITALISSCENRNAQDLYPGGSCDTLSVTFSGTVRAIINTNCAVSGCHMGTAPAGNLSYETYNGVKTVAADGRLLKAINHLSGASPMPKNLPKLDDCTIRKVTIWVNAGYLEN